MIRPLRITDIAGLPSFMGRPPVNEARTRDSFVSGSDTAAPIGSMLMSCLVPSSRHRSLVYTRRGQIEGLACLRQLSGHTAWEVERLLLAPGHEEFCVDLMERLGAAGDEVGIERLFLRLDSSSRVVDMARQAGFGQYQTEILHRCDEPRQPATPALSRSLRPRSSADEHRLFRLYSSAVPVQVRAAEGMTFREWKHSRNRRGDAEYVVEQADDLSSWLWIKHRAASGQLALMSKADASELRDLVEYALSVLRGKRPVFCLVPDSEVELMTVLADEGFGRVAEYSCLSKQLALRVREPRWVPLQA